LINQAPGVAGSRLITVIWVRHANEVAEIEDPTEKITEPVEVSHHLPVFINGGGIDNFIHKRRRSLEVAMREDVEPLGSCKISILEEAGILAVWPYPRSGTQVG
jgi:hypothetical protein